MITNLYHAHAPKLVDVYKLTKLAKAKANLYNVYAYLPISFTRQTDSYQEIQKSSLGGKGQRGGDEGHTSSQAGWTRLQTRLEVRTEPGR